MAIWIRARIRVRDTRLRREGVRPQGHGLPRRCGATLSSSEYRVVVPPTQSTGIQLGKRAYGGLGLVALAALLYSLMPFSLDRAVGDVAPFTVGLGVLIGYVFTNTIDRRRLSRRIARWSKSSIDVTYQSVWNHLRYAGTEARGAWIGLCLVLMSTADYVVFALATVHVDAAIASSMFEAWPLIWLFVLARTDASSHGPRRHKRHPWHTYGLMLLALPAIALVAASAEDLLGSSGTDLQLPVLGIGLALLAPIVSAGGAGAILFTDRVLFEPRVPEMEPKDANLYETWLLSKRKLDASELHDLKSIMSRTSLIVTRIPALVVVLPFAMNEASIWSGLFWVSILGGGMVGALLHGPASISLHEAHFISDRREIISLQYLSPLFALIWLALFSEISIARIDLLLLGTVAIVAINMLINLDPEIIREDAAFRERHVAQQVGYIEPNLQPTQPTANDRHSLRALILTLLLSGGFVYFRNEIFTGTKFYWGPGNYWAAIALAATVFALLLAFRLTRVENLISAEDYRTLALVRSIEMLPDSYFTEFRPDSKRYLLDWIRGLNKGANLSEYRRCYNQAHQSLHRMVERITPKDIGLGYDERREIANIRTELDALANGRQHARELAERIALWLIGAAVITLAVSVPNEHSPWASFLADSLAVILASVVVFLLAHLADLRRARGDELLREKDPTWKYLEDGLYIRFRDDADTTWQRAFTSIIVLGISATIFGLLFWSRVAS